MEEWNDDLLEKTKKGTWTGRPVKKGPLYFYQCVEEIKNLEKVGEGDIVLTGYACDEGVRRNKGRIGAVQGPISIKKALAKTAFTSKVWDMGDVICVDGKMEESQAAVAKVTLAAIKASALPINIGGGHDIAFATGSGVYDALKAKKYKIGIINFDAHFDLRTLQEKGNSGTPFYQLAKLCKSYDLDFTYLVLGIQKQSNTEELFETAAELNVNYVLNQDLNQENIGKAIKELISKVDKLYVSIDLDAFSASFAPGVSAANPIGMHPNLALESLKRIFDSGKVCAVDIAEMNPSCDIDNRTAKLAAYLINEICRLFLSCSHES